MEAARRAVAEHVPGAAVFPLLVTGGTDGRYFRQRGYAAYGFGPTLLDASDISRVHGIDERISPRQTWCWGVKIVRDMLRDLTVVG
jgi:acetylornithine deacetylase/succinyl-diaminopimelate desuccinylase-like protein